MMNTLIDLIQSFKDNKNPALIYHNGYRRFEYDYNNLYCLILKTADYLNAKGIDKNDKVLLWGPNGPDWIIAYFGIVALGATVVPVDLKSDRVAALKIAASAGIKIVIKTKYKRSINYETIYLEELQNIIKNRQLTKELASCNKNDLAELVYTSGTTGDPKGVMISHHNLVSNMTAVVKKINVNRNDCLLSVLPLSHLFEQTAGMLTPLSVGARVVYLATIKPSEIFKALKQEPITIFLCVPRLLQGFKKGIQDKFGHGAKKYIYKILSFVSSFAKDENKKKIWFLVHSKFNKHFRFFVSGGSYLDPDTEKFWEGIGFKIVQGYGLSECSPILTVNQENARRISSIGRPLDNVELKINQDKELMARGPNIFKGYYQNEEKTREAFDDDWFLTGDIAEIDSDGFYYIKSRKKDMIVTSDGINVYPEEIENVINKIEGVKEAVILGFDQGKGEEVNAVIIPEIDLLDVGVVIKEANKHLSGSQQIMHAHVWSEAEFPKTTTLKVKKNLVLKKLKKDEGLNDINKSASGVIKAIAMISGLPINEIRPEKLIYRDLKIDSIGRVELVSRLEQEFTLDISEDSINERTSVSDLEKMIEKRISEGKKYNFYSWNFSSIIVSLRTFHWIYFGRPFLRIWCRVKAEGIENIKNLPEPVIFAPNHNTFVDSQSVLLALPELIRQKTAIAAWREFFFRDANIMVRGFFRIFFYYVLVFWGIYPFSQITNTKKTLEYTGFLMDKNVNIMLFPEGKRSQDGKLLPFGKGISIIAKSLKCPIVPVAIIGADNVLKYGQVWPRRGNITVRFGQAIKFTTENDHEILDKLKNEIEKLKKNI
jgi:long-chain acyl-CoA synthetase